jgi:integrase
VIYTFEECALRDLEEIAHKSSADTMAMHLDQLFPFIGPLPIAQVHDGTIRPFIELQRNRGLSPKSINNALGVVSTVLNRAARVWRGEDGQPWLTQAPALISRLSVKGQQAKPYPLSWAEQDRLIKVLPRHVADAMLFAVNTGCREQEICQLRWDWEVALPGHGTSVFVLPASITKTSTERVVVLNSIARRVIETRRGTHTEYVFTYQGNPLKKLHTSAWKRAWRLVGLPTEKGILKGVHNLRHTFGKRLRSAGVPLETRKALLGHANGDITTHYSAAELGELIDAAEAIVNRRTKETPNLMLISRQTARGVGIVSEMKKGLTGKIG